MEPAEANANANTASENLLFNAAALPQQRLPSVIVKVFKTVLHN